MFWRRCNIGKRWSDPKFMSYIFIDESGQYKKYYHKSYFVIAAFSVVDPKISAKRFRSWCRDHFPRKMRDQNEIKWSTSSIDYNLRLRTLKIISKLDMSINFVYLHYRNIPVNYYRKGKLLSGLLYTDMIHTLLVPYLKTNSPDIRIFCDQRELGDISLVEFRKVLETSLAKTIKIRTGLQIDMVNSTSNVNIQIADWIVGAIASYLEKEVNGRQFYGIISGHIIQSKKDFFTKNP